MGSSGNGQLKMAIILIFLSSDANSRLWFFLAEYLITGNHHFLIEERVSDGTMEYFW
jgi:hypothetical protein